jgi:RimJ/RimL family protein N-acetyltransferase
MIELKPSEFALAAPLFAGIDHNVPIVFSVLKGAAAGRVFVDDAGRPRSAFVAVGGAFSYVAGDETDDAFGCDLVALIFEDQLSSQEEQELVLFAFTDAWRARLDQLLAPKGAIRIHRKTFAWDADRAPAWRLWRDRMPAGYRMESTALAEGDSRFGVRLMKGEGEAVSECTSVFVGRGEAEIDIHTDENHRQLGLGTLTASAFLEECLARGLRPNWTCWPEREASIALAKKLGFVEKADVPAHLWVPEFSPSQAE